jgi:hypothetical protein
MSSSYPSATRDRHTPWAWLLAALALAVWAVVPVASTPTPAPVVVDRGTVCTLIAGPGNAFTYVPAPAQVQMRAQALAANANASPATVTVTYVGFDSFPAAQAAFQNAVDIWSSLISSPVPISVRAEFKALGTNVLGSAGSQYIWHDFSGAPVASTWYPDALADDLHGSDNNPGQFDIMASFNSAFSSWYFGTDGRPPGGQYDFVTVVLHELGHGLGFLGSGTVSGGVGSLGFSGVPMIFDRFAATETGAALLGLANPSAALGTQLTQGFNAGNPRGPGVYWAGPGGVAGNGGLTARLYTPSSWASGSSYSHLDEDVFPAGDVNSLMTPVLSGAEAIHNPGPITLGMFADMGWGTVSTPTLPIISVQPQSQTIVTNHTATLQVVATGPGALAYQWYQGTSPSTTTPIAGANGSSYTTPLLTATTRYWVRVSNTAGSVDSSTATITVTLPGGCTSVQPGPLWTCVNGGWLPPGAGGPPPDTDGDGVPDSTDQCPTVFARTPTGCPAPAARGDINGDGKPDLVFHNANTGLLYAWYLSNGALVGESMFTPTVNDPALTLVSKEDFTGDGQNDLLWSNPATGELSLWPLNGVTLQNNASVVVPVAAGSWRVVATADFNGDGNPDFLWQRPASGDLYVWLLQKMVNGQPVLVGEGPLVDAQNQPIVSPGADWRVAAVGDINGDGSPDLILQNQTTKAVVAWYLNGRTVLNNNVPIVSSAGPWRVRMLSDMNSDGQLDIVWQNVIVASRLYVWFLNGASVIGDGFLGPTQVLGPEWRLVGGK